MKNWERILEEYKECNDFISNHATGMSLMNSIPKAILLEIIGEWNYAEYETEQEQFANNFRKQLSSFLYRVIHWTQDDLEKMGFDKTRYVAPHYVVKVMNEMKGSRNFELWLLTEEGNVFNISTNNKECTREMVKLSKYESTLAIQQIDKMKDYKAGHQFAYLMYLYQADEISPVYLKVGKSGNINARQQQLIDQYNLSKIEVIKTFEFDDGDTAEMMESFMRKFYKIKYQGKNFTPKDRFEGGICADEELTYFEKKARLIAAAAEL